jgi:DNA-binding winged helix-turn-helix (wHTH) protein/tetratricopeptide (TPR) repeat protein
MPLAANGVIGISLELRWDVLGFTAVATERRRRMNYVFDDFSLDADRRELRQGGGLIAVEPQTFDLLLYLLQNRQRVTSKDQLMDTVWGGRVVSESTLGSQIAAVRHAIGDDGVRQLRIRTFPRKGFRFVGDVQEANGLPHEGLQTSVAGADPDVRTVANAKRPEVRQLTVMICELVETAPTPHRSADPEEALAAVSVYRSCVESIVIAYDGFVEKALGHEVLVYFGYPRAHEDDAERAVRAALEVVSAVARLQAGSKKSLRARVAIATGPAVIGASKTSEHSAGHDAIGDVLPLATRLLADAQAGTVLISAATRTLTGRLFEYRQHGPSASTPAMDPVEVLCDSAIASRFEALRPTLSSLVGREEEFALLQRRWAQVKAGNGRVVLIYGEPGIGKSRLAFAIQETIKDDKHRSLRFYGSPHRTQSALHPVINQLEQAAGLHAAKDDGARLQRLRRLLGQSSQDIDGDTALFADLLLIATREGSPAFSLSPQRRKELVLERLVSRLESLAAQEPLLVVLEDAHWVDPTTLEWFDVIVERVRTLPILLIMTYRPEFAPPWLGQSHVTVLTLNRLDRRETEVLVRQVAGGDQLDSTLVDQIVTRADGVPLFVEEIAKSVIENATRPGETPRSGPHGSSLAPTVPATLQASLVARLDRLASNGVLQAGAALGREFTYAMLRSVCGLDDNELATTLRQLVASELVHQRGTAPHAVYTFKHALVQDAAYGTMLRSQRLQMHARIVEVLEQDFPEMSQRNPEVLAHHCEEAGNFSRALEYRLKAARMVLDRSAGGEARGQVERALALLSSIEDAAERRRLEGRAHIVRSEALVMTEGFASPEVAAELSAARALLDESAYPVETLRAVSGLFNYHLMRSEAPKAFQLVEPLLQRSSDRRGTMVANFLAGSACLHIGRFEDGARHLEQALSLYDEDESGSVALISGYHVRSFSLVWLALTRLYLGKLDAAIATMATAIADARRRHHPFTLVSALLASARFHDHIRDFAGAIAATDEGLAIAIEQRSPYHVSRANILRAVNVVHGGKASEGILLMNSALLEHRKTGANFQSSFNLSCLAEAFASSDIACAVDYASQAVANVEDTGERWWTAEAYRIKGEILLKSASRKGDAEACFQASLDAARAQGAKFWELRAVCSLAGLWKESGRSAEAKALLRRICQWFGEAVDLPDLARARQLLDEPMQSGLARNPDAKRNKTRQTAGLTDW